MTILCTYFICSPWLRYCILTVLRPSSVSGIVSTKPQKRHSNENKEGAGWTRRHPLTGLSQKKLQIVYFWAEVHIIEILAAATVKALRYICSHSRTRDSSSWCCFAEIRMWLELGMGLVSGAHHTSNFGAACGTRLIYTKCVRLEDLSWQLSSRICSRKTGNYRSPLWAQSWVRELRVLVLPICIWVLHNFAVYLQPKYIVFRNKGVYSSVLAACNCKYTSFNCENCSWR